MSDDYAIIKSRCEILLRRLDQGNRKSTDDALYELYRTLVLHYQPPPLGVAVKDELNLEEKLR